MLEPQMKAGREWTQIIYKRTQIRFTSILLLCITKYETYMEKISLILKEENGGTRILNEIKLHFTCEANRTPLLDKEILKICSSLYNFWKKNEDMNRERIIWAQEWGIHRLKGLMTSTET